jgi:hypothetical protein
MSLINEFFLLVIIALLVGLKGVRECFGTSPGTLVQLAANHVPTNAELQAASGYYYPGAGGNQTILIVIIMMLVLLLGAVLGLKNN